MNKASFIIGTLLLLASGCDDFLAEEPVSFINPNTFFQTAADADAAVVAGYDFYGGFNPGTFGWWRDYTFEVVSDDFVNRPLGNSNNARELALYNDFLPSTVLIESVYTNHVEGLNNYTIAIDGIENMESFGGQAALVAEAKYLRAYSYFHLVRLFGRVPVIEEPLTIEEVTEVPRAGSVDEVYDLIIRDLEAGVADLPEAAIAPGRATRWAAMALLAKVHLTRENWSEAATLAARVIAESPHELLPVYTDIFSDNNENNAESIFEIQMLLGDERSNQVGNWPRGVGSDGSKDFFLGPNWGGLYIATQNLLDSFEPNDARRNLIATSVTRSDGTLIEFNADGEEPHYALKRVPNSYIEGVEANNNSSYNYIYMRLGEVYLIAAEAENEANGPGNAYAFINPIRTRAGLEPLSGLNQEQFREAVRNERRHELYDERKRYFDLLRWGNVVQRTREVKPTASIKDHNVLWPIPQDAVDRNPALQGDQNPGY